MAEPLDSLLTIELLLRESSEARYSDPTRMVYLAELAQAAANRLSPTHHPPEVIADTQARVWAELGNAYRVADALDHSEKAFGQAVDALERGSGDPVLSADVALRFANLLCHRRRYDEAFALLERVAAAYLAAGKPLLAGKALIDRGAHAINSGDAKACIVYTAAGLELLGRDAGEDLLLAAVHNVLAAATDLGYHELVESWLPSVRPFYGSKKLLLLRLRWLEARVAAGQGRSHDAETAFREARAGFDAAQLGFPSALVGLDLAVLLVDSGRYQEVVSLAEELLETFRALQVGREVTLAVLLLKRACEAGVQAAELMRERISTARKLLLEAAFQSR